MVAFIKTGLILGIATVVLLGSNGLIWAAEQGLDFVVPPPKNSEFLGSKNLKIAGRDIEGKSYKSENTPQRIISDYQYFFSKENFQETVNTVLPENKGQRIQFKKENFVVDIVLVLKDYGADVAVATYTLPEGAKGLEDLKPALGDTFLALPKQDLPGEDLENIPRPAQSVRISSFDAANQKYVTYVSKLSITEILDFYQQEMPQEGWQLKQELDMGKTMADYKRLTGKKDLGLGEMKTPFQGGRDLEEAMSNAYLLDYISDSGYARINIMPNVMANDLSTVVQITYSEEQNEIR